MRLSFLRIVVALGAALLVSANHPIFAQSADSRSGNARQSGTNGEAQKKLDEFVEAAKRLGGPAAHPECVWLGRRVVGLLWRDDLDTAFRHLDLYDRFGCPAGHIQATFRCLVRQGSIDLKGAESLARRVHSCWIDPTIQVKPAGAGTQPSSAAASSGTASR